jgi:gluconolactonase
MRTKLESYSDRFDRLIAPEAQLKRLFSGTAWAEGPAYVKSDNALVWSDVPNNRMYRWTPDHGGSVFRSPSNYSNGNTVDRSGRLLTCEHLTHRISRTEPDGTIVPLVDNYRGKRFNSPNDLVVKSDDSIWFTDPPYGILSNYEGVQQESAVGGNFVYRFDPATGDLTIVADDFDKPNGLAFSPDESVLYVADTGGTHTPNGPHHIRAFDVSAGSQLSNSRVFAEVSPGFADGFRVDEAGNVFTSAFDGIQVFSPDGELLGKILVPERATANCAFGGDDNSTLFITASTALYAIETSTRGAISA